MTFPSDAHDWALEDYQRHVEDYRNWLSKVSKQSGVSVYLLKEITKDLNKVQALIDSAKARGVKKKARQKLTRGERKCAADIVFWIDMKAIKVWL